MDEAGYTKCSCQHCSGHIAFVPTNFKEGSTKRATCPHCGQETTLECAPLKQASSTFSPFQSLVIPGAAIKQNVPTILFIIALASFTLCFAPLLGLFFIPIAALIGLIFVGIGVINYEARKSAALIFLFSGGGVSLFSIIAFVTKIVIHEHDVHLQAKTNQASNEARADANKVLWSTSSTVKQGDIEITIKEISVRRMRSGSSEMQAYDTTNLCVKLEIKNLSETNKHSFIEWLIKKPIQNYSVSVDSWEVGGTNSHAFSGFIAEGSTGKSRPAILADSNGNHYKQYDYHWHNNPDDFSIYPACSLIQGLVFEKPVRNSKWFHLELPAENFGGIGVIRFEIPVIKIEVGNLD
jgi:hypothetical protein